MKRNSIVTKLLEEILPIGLSKTGLKKASSERHFSIPSSVFLRKSSADIPPMKTCPSNSSTPCSCNKKLNKRSKKNKQQQFELTLLSKEQKYVLSLMFYAIQYKNSELLEEILSSTEMDTNLLNEDGISASHFAAIVGCTHSLRILRKYGSCLNIHDIRGQTPIYYARMMEKHEAVTALKQLGAQ